MAHQECHHALVASLVPNWHLVRTVNIIPRRRERVVRGVECADVGHAIRVRLLSVDIERGFIDFARVDLAGHS